MLLHKLSGTIAAAQRELRGFLNELKSGAYGDVLPQVIEVGNEYYAHDFLTGRDRAEAYGDIAQGFAETIRNALGDDVDIAVQAGRRTGENKAILKKFAGHEDLVDSVIIHSYPWTMAGVVDDVAKKTTLTDAWAEAGVANDVILSEWNISSHYRSNNGDLFSPDIVERGVGQSIGLLELAYGYLAAGVDAAAVWPLQQNMPGDLGGNEGDDATARNLTDRGLSLVGEAYRLLSEATPGKTVLSVDNIDLDGVAESARFEDEIILQAYESRSEVVLFASAFDLTAAQIGSKISFDLPGRFTEAEVTRLTSAASSPHDPNGVAVIEEEVISPLTSSDDLTLTFTESYEVFRVVFQKLGGEYLVGTKSADQTFGGVDDDQIFGLSGKDTLIGGRGGDTIEGNGSSDAIRAGAGNDKVAGGAGGDLISGGKGSDLITGGGGADRLLGGAGADQINAGSGRDFVRGGGGDDQIRGAGGHDDLRGGGGDDTLTGGGGDDRMTGQSGDDVLIATSGDDTLTGGDGADSFEFSASSSSHVVTDFDAGEDLLILRGVDASAVSFAETDAGAAIHIDDLTIGFDGLDVDTLAETDIFFA
ncbi:MAG: calcium-binding protein [Pseudomonadota bacterium]